jgi:hypothetical protein
MLRLAGGSDIESGRSIPTPGAAGLGYGSREAPTSQMEE